MTISASTYRNLYQQVVPGNVGTTNTYQISVNITFHTEVDVGSSPDLSDFIFLVPNSNGASFTIIPIKDDGNNILLAPLPLRSKTGNIAHGFNLRITVRGFTHIRAITGTDEFTIYVIRKESELGQRVTGDNVNNDIEDQLDEMVEYAQDTRTHNVSLKIFGENSAEREKLRNTYLKPKENTLIGFDSEKNLKLEPFGSGEGGGGSIIVEERLQKEINNIIGKDGNDQTETSANLDNERKSLEKLKIDLDIASVGLGDNSQPQDSNGSAYQRIFHNRDGIQALKNTVDGYVDRSNPSSPRAVPGNTTKIKELQSEVASFSGLDRKIEEETKNRQLHDAAIQAEVDVNRGKLPKDIQLLDIPKLGNNTKSGALAETYLNNSKDLLGAGVKSADAFLTGYQRTTDGTFRFQEAQRHQIGDGTTTNSARPIEFYKTPSPISIGEADPGALASVNCNIYTVASDGVEVIDGLKLPETIGGKSNPFDAEFRVPMSELSRDYWVPRNERHVVEFEIEGRKVPGVINIVAPLDENTGAASFDDLLVYVTLPDSTFDQMDLMSLGFGVGPSGEFRRVTDLTRSLSIFPTITVGGQRRDCFTFVASVRKEILSNLGTIGNLGAGTISSRTARVGFNLAVQTGTGLLKFYRVIQNRIENVKAVEAIRIQAATLNSETLGLESEDPDGSGSVYKRISTARKTGGGTTVTKGLDITPLFDLDATANAAIPYTITTQNARDILLAADYIIVQIATGSNRSTAVWYPLEIPKSYYDKLLWNTSEDSLTAVAGPGGTVSLRIIGNSNQITRVQQLRANGSYNNITSNWGFIRYIAAHKETFTIS